MSAHDCGFFARQGSGLVQDGERGSRLVEIVQQGGSCNVFLIAPRKLQAGGELRSETGDQKAVCW